jgi:hypothetical protein
MKGVTFIFFLAVSLNSMMGQSTDFLKTTFTSVPYGVVDLLERSATRYETVQDTVYKRQKVYSYRSYDSTVTFVGDVDSSVRVLALYYNDSKVIVRKTWVNGYQFFMGDEVLYIPRPFYQSGITTYPVEVGYPDSFLGTGVYFESFDQMAFGFQKGISEQKGESIKIGELDYLSYKGVEGHFWVYVPKVFPNVVYLH